MEIQNAKTLPEVFYGMHMEPGVAEYREPGIEPYRIFVNEETIKNMDPTFVGRPVYVHHVDGVNLDKIQEQADGYVVESFFNQADGKHWAKFILVSDKGKEAIRSGWRLSNAYKPKNFKSGGMWHGVDYQKEIINAEYEHLAIVQNPRYEGSVILTPEQFKEYNSNKEIELKRLANSKGDTSVFNFFKKTKVENSAEFDSMSIILPKSKIEKTISEIINVVDEYELKMKEPVQMVNMDHHVDIGGEKMSVNDLVSKHMAMCQEMDDMKKKMAGEAKPEVAEEKKNDDMMKEPKAEENEEKMEMKKNETEEGQKHFEALKNAEKNVEVETVKIDLDKMARGKARYGSN